MKRASVRLARGDIAAIEQQGKKREAKGKVPFFTYKVLTLKPSKRSSGEGLGGTHASPRVHLRRGHIRRLPDKRIWVNGCVVGDKSKGMVVKDYAVPAIIAP